MRKLTWTPFANSRRSEENSYRTKESKDEIERSNEVLENKKYENKV